MGLPHDDEFANKSRITLREKSIYEFAITVSPKTASSNMLNRIANLVYKARADWLNHFYSTWESEGYEVES